MQQKFINYKQLAQINVNFKQLAQINVSQDLVR